MLGYAATVKIRGSAPPIADGAYPDRTDWWDHIASQPAPRVVVIQDVATRPGLGALVGEVHMNILQALNCAGVVTNGSVRSIPAAERAGFHLFAGSVSVSHAYVHIIEIGTPVEVGGLKIRPGICCMATCTASNPSRWALRRRFRPSPRAFPPGNGS